MVRRVLDAQTHLQNPIEADKRHKGPGLQIQRQQRKENLEPVELPRVEIILGVQRAECAPPAY